MSGDIVNGTPAQTAYCHTIRTSLAAFDQVRLNAVVAGLTVCNALFIAINYVKAEQIPMLGSNKAIPIGYITGAFFFLISGITSLNFCMKVQLFNYFIRTAVQISLLLEENIVPNENLQNENLRFTNEFNKMNLIKVGAQEHEETCFYLRLYLLHEPCAMRFGAIPWSGVRRVISGARNSDVRSVGFDEGPRVNDWLQSWRKGA